jgi:hypothetical protein
LRVFGDFLAWPVGRVPRVPGSASAIFLAIYLGLRETLLAGGVLYVCALGTVRLTEESAETGRAPAAAESPVLEES